MKNVEKKKLYVPDLKFSELKNRSVSIFCKPKISFFYYVIILFYGCRYSRLPNDLAIPSVLCYSEQKGNVKNKLRTDGFYLSKILYLNESTGNSINNQGSGSKGSNEKFDSAYIYTAEIYFEKGLWVNFYSGYEMYKDGRSLNNIIDTLKKFLKSISYNKRNNFFYTDSYWGTYVVKDDTLIKYGINHPSLFDGFWTPGLQKDFIEESKLVPHSYSNLKVRKNDNRKVTYRVYSESESEEKSLDFIPFETLPSSEFAWILKERVFWCNESEFKAAHK